MNGRRDKTILYCPYYFTVTVSFLTSYSKPGIKFWISDEYFCDRDKAYPIRLS